MEKFNTLNSVAVSLNMDNLDTDQLMPKQFLRGITKEGLAQGLFYNLRFNSDGAPNPESPFNQKGLEKAQVIVAGPNFGCGSSREHAVWGLLQYGIRTVVAPSFGEIFYSNAFNNGLLAAKVSPSDCESLFKALEENPLLTLTVDLPNQTITAGSFVIHFDLSAYHKMMLTEGLDMIDATLRDIDAIEAFKAKHEAEFPWMSRLPGKYRRERDK